MDIPLTNIRKTIAKRLTESKHTIPHSYVSVSLRADKLSKIRKELAKDGRKVSVNDFLVKAVALALRVGLCCFGSRSTFVTISGRP